jgi:hypothetical protein
MCLSQQQLGGAMYYLLVVGLTIATLIPGAITASQLGQEPAPSQITAIYKNPPTIADIETRSMKTEKGNKVHRGKAVVFPRRSQD